MANLRIERGVMCQAELFGRFCPTIRQNLALFSLMAKEKKQIVDLVLFSAAFELAIEFETVLAESFQDLSPLARLPKTRGAGVSRVPCRSNIFFERASMFQQGASAKKIKMQFGRADAASHLPQFALAVSHQRGIEFCRLPLE